MCVMGQRTLACVLEKGPGPVTKQSQSRGLGIANISSDRRWEREWGEYPPQTWWVDPPHPTPLLAVLLQPIIPCRACEGCFFW